MSAIQSLEYLDHKIELAEQELLTDKSIEILDALSLLMGTKGIDRIAGVSYKDLSSITLISVLGQNKESVMIVREKEDLGYRVLASSLDHSLADVLEDAVLRVAASLTPDDFENLGRAYQTQLSIIENRPELIDIRSIRAYERILDIREASMRHKNRLAS